MTIALILWYQLCFERLMEGFRKISGKQTGERKCIFDHQRDPTGKTGLDDGPYLS